MSERRRLGGSRRPGFTLLELLVVIAIISILAGMTLGVTVMVKDRAKALATESRMQTVLNGLTEYGAASGSPAVALQTTFDLGGVASFAPIKVINDSIQVGTQNPPGFVQWVYYPNAPQWGNPPTVSRFAFDKTNYAADIERLTLWRRLSDEVNDAMPSPGWSLADYERPSARGWPTQWPETDWDLAIPGTSPPILRFPWGKPGLRIDGTLCDPNKDDSSSSGAFSEFQTSTGHRVTGNNADPKLNPPASITNRWVTQGSAAVGRIWQWSNPGGVTQTDSIVLTQATRSDGSLADVTSPSKNANCPMPFDEGWMSPLKSLQLLQAAGVVRADPTGEKEYRESRKVSAAWNDAWGHPLIVVYAMFQPERYIRTFDSQNRRDLLLKAASKEYQYSRSLYFAVGAPGPVLDPTQPLSWSPGADATTLRDYWKIIRTTARAVDWNENSFTAPAWKGIRARKAGGFACFLTTPIEIK